MPKYTHSLSLADLADLLVFEFVDSKSNPLRVVRPIRVGAELLFAAGPAERSLVLRASLLQIIHCKTVTGKDSIEVWLTRLGEREVSAALARLRAKRRCRP